MSKALRRAIQQLQVQFQIAQNNYNREKSLARDAQSRFDRERQGYTNTLNTIQRENAEAAALAQSRFDQQLAESREANAATVEGLNKLLIDQQDQAKAQQAQFSAAQQASEARYQEQLQRSQRLAAAYIPGAQPTAGAPLVGDQRKALTPSATRTRGSLNNLSIVNKPSGGGTNQVSGLQIA